MRYPKFGTALRAFLDDLEFKDRNRWFRESVGREDRYLRRWCQGQNLPSPDNWQLFVDAAKNAKGGQPDFHGRLADLEALLRRERQAATKRDLNTLETLQPSKRKTAESTTHAARMVVGEVSPKSGSLQILALATEWFSRHGGVSTLNRLLCKALATVGHQVICVAESPTHEEIESARNDGVHLRPPRVWPGIKAREALGQPLDLPFGFRPVVVIGHGPHTGPAAKVQKDNWYHDSVRMHFIHVDSGVIEPHKPNPDHGHRADDKVLTELPLASTADVVVGVGPRLYKTARDLVMSTYPSPFVLRLDPGFEVSSVRERIPDRLLLLVTGRMEDAHLKGLDIVAEALGMVQRSGRIKGTITLRVRGAPTSDQEAIRRFLLDTSGHADLVFESRPFSTNTVLRRQDYLEASLALMPSREEGFGLATLEALEHGTPILVSNKTGVADLLEEHFPEFVASVVVDTPEDRTTAARQWAARIAEALLNRDASFSSTRALQRGFAAAFSWQKAAVQLVSPVASVVKGPGNAVYRSTSVPLRSDKSAQLSTKRLTSCSWSLDDKFIYAGGFDGMLYCCDLDFRENKKLRVSPSIIRVVKCLTSIPLPIVADDRGRLLLADLANGVTHELASRDSSVFGIEAAGDDDKIIVCDRNGSVVELQIQRSSSVFGGPTAVLLRSIQEHSGPAFGAQCDRWRNCILSVGADGCLRSLDLTTGTRASVKSCDHALFSLDVSASSDLIALGSQDGLISVVKANKQDVFVGHTDAVRSVRISPQGRWLVSGSKDASIRLWSVSSGRTWLLAQAQDYVYEVAFSSEGNRLLAVDGTGLVRLISFSQPIDQFTPDDLDKMCSNA